MAFLMDDSAVGGQFVCGAGLPKALGVGKAKINDVTIYRKIKIMDGQLNITDFSEDSSLSEYKRWSSRKDGSKYSFSKGYKRFN